MSAKAVRSNHVVVTDTWGDHIAWRFDGDGDVVIFRCDKSGNPLTTIDRGDACRSHVQISRADMQVLLERYKETL